MSVGASGHGHVTANGMNGSLVSDVRSFCLLTVDPISHKIIYKQIEPTNGIHDKQQFESWYDGSDNI